MRLAVIGAVLLAAWASLATLLWHDRLRRMNVLINLEGLRVVRPHRGSGDGTGIGAGAGGDLPGRRFGRTAFVTVRTGLFGMSESFAPLAGASIVNQSIKIRYSKELVAKCPRIESERGSITSDEEQEIYRYFGLDGVTPADDGATVPPAGTSEPLPVRSPPGWRAAGASPEDPRRIRRVHLRPSAVTIFGPGRTDTGGAGDRLSCFRTGFGAIVPL
jgi:hypothetical protein